MKRPQFVYLLLLVLLANQHTTEAFLFKTASKLLPKIGKLFKLEDSAEVVKEEKHYLPEPEPAPKEEKKSLFDLPKLLFKNTEKLDLFKPKLFTDLFNLKDKLAEKHEKFVEKLEEKDEIKDKLLDIFEEKKEEILDKKDKEDCHIKAPEIELKYVPEVKYVHIPAPPPPPPVHYSYVHLPKYEPEPPVYHDYEPPVKHYKYYEPEPVYEPEPPVYKPVYKYKPAPEYLPEPPHAYHDYEPPVSAEHHSYSYLPYPQAPPYVVLPPAPAPAPCDEPAPVNYHHDYYKPAPPVYGHKVPAPYVDDFST